MRATPWCAARCLAVVLSVAVAGAVVPVASGAGAAAAPRTPTRAGGAAAAPGPRNAAGTAAYVPGEVLVRFEGGPASAAKSVQAAHAAAGAAASTRLGGVPGLQRVTLKRGVSVESAIAAYRAMPSVRYAQPNYLRRPAATYPTDPLFSAQWGLNNTGQTGGIADKDIDAPDAWGIETGSHDVIVAVIDTGVDYDHPDLANNMWKNSAEASGLPGVDDDGNGYVDDVYGIDTLNGDTDPMDDVDHGTRVAGTIGAEGGNALGVTGVAWDVSIMAVKAFGTASSSDATCIAAIEYATAMGADIVNCSWGSTGVGEALRDAIAASPGVLFVCGAGNDGASNDGAAPFFPASFDLPNVISVAATDDRDALASFSNFGPTSVDLAAAGVDIMSTVPGLWHTIASDGLSSDAAWSTGFDLSPAWNLKTTKRFASAPYGASRTGYGNNEVSWLEYTPALDLSAYPAYDLEFAVWMDLERNDALGKYDVLYVMASTDGDYYTSIDAYSGDSLGWIPLTVSLPASYVGQSSVHLAFLLDSDPTNSSAQGYEGVYIDDVKVLADTGTPDYADAYRGLYSGTSMAAPFVSGVAALLKAADPALTAVQMKAHILSGVDVVPGLKGKVATGGRLNAYRALATLPGNALPSSITIKTSATTARTGSIPILAGAVTPDQMIGQNIVAYVRKPGKAYFSYSSNRTVYDLGGKAAWQYKYAFKRGMAKGYYVFKAGVPGWPGFLTSTSPTTVSIRLR